MRSHSVFVFAGAIALSMSAADHARAASIVSNFEDGTVQGWTVVNAITFEQRTPDGNPNGYLYIDNNEGGLASIFAPAAFLGNLSAFNGGSFSFDGRLFGSGGSFYDNTGQDYGSVTITGSNADSATIDLLPNGATASAGVWQTFSTSLSAANWGKTDVAWAAILADVTGIRIGVEALFGPEIQGIDNITFNSLDQPPTGTPVPGALPLFAGGLGVLGYFPTFSK